MLFLKGSERPEAACLGEYYLHWAIWIHRPRKTRRMWTSVGYGNTFMTVETKTRLPAPRPQTLNRELSAASPQQL